MKRQIDGSSDERWTKKCMNNRFFFVSLSGEFRWSEGNERRQWRFRRCLKLHNFLIRTQTHNVWGHKKTNDMRALVNRRWAIQFSMTCTRTHGMRRIKLDFFVVVEANRNSTAGLIVMPDENDLNIISLRWNLNDFSLASMNLESNGKYKIEKNKRRRQITADDSHFASAEPANDVPSRNEQHFDFVFFFSFSRRVASSFHSMY